MKEDRPASPRGRGADQAPANRFGEQHFEPDFSAMEHDEEALAQYAQAETEYIADHSKSIISHNDSPDVGFDYSLNPYRGCSHGCAYCYARPTHEYLGLNAGLDFETKVFVKHDAPALLRDFLTSPKWAPQPIILSGVTDPYQPAERQFGITRGCLEVALEAKQPIGIITKNALITRDLDLLREMARRHLVHANISVTTLDASLAKELEPRTSAPHARLNAIRQLREAGIPVRVMTAPIIPGLNDSEIPKLLRAASEAGAQSAAYVMLRLPMAVAPVFQDWLDRTLPYRRSRVEAFVKMVRGGKLNQCQFGERMRGTGPVARQIDQLFHKFTRQYGLDASLPAYNVDQFVPPASRSGQMYLF